MTNKKKSSFLLVLAHAGFWRYTPVGLDLASFVIELPISIKIRIFALQIEQMSRDL
jgi:hypothetical protein